MEENKPIFISPSAAAKLISVSRSKLYDLVRRGEIPYRKFGSSIRIPAAALQKMAADAAAEQDRD